MKKANHANIKQATEYVQNLIAEGGTNVHDSLMDGLDILQNANDVGVNAPIIVFLTDGDPTVGVTNFKELLNAVEAKNKDKIQIFSLAFGRDAKLDFLKKLSARNNAFARKVYADADAKLQLTGFYKESSDVLLSNLDDTINLTSLTQSEYSSFFDGSELVVSGRLDELGSDFNSLSLFVVGNGNKGFTELSSTTPLDSQDKNSIPDFKTRLDFSIIVEKTLAYLTIKNY